MKNIIFSIVFFTFFINTQAQTKDVIILKTGKVVDCNITSIDTANNSLTCTNSFGNLIGEVPFDKIESYSINGTNYSIPQELKYSDLNSGEKPKGKYTSYVAKNGTVYKIGDKIKIGYPSSNKTFAFIWAGDGILTPTVPLDAYSSGQTTEIKRIDIAGTQRTGFVVCFRCKGIIATFNYGIQIENALETGEIVSSVISSDEALTELKKAKDKLDLGLITQEEFDILKAELRKYIK